MYLISEKIINIKEVHAFEKFLVKRFNLSSATIKIRYEFEPEIDIQNEWDNIVDYLSYRYPMTKAILRNSEVQIDSSVINVNLHMTGKDFLTARGMNKVFENTLENIYGQKYKINFAESISAEEEQKYKEFTKSLEDTALTEFAKKMEEHKLEKEKKKEEKSNNNADDFEIKNVNAPTPDSLPPLPDDKDAPPIPEEEPEEITPLIYGRNPNIKDPFTKVIDISVDSGKICLEGEILNSEERLLKSGKTLYAFDLYDGSSTITCKAFVEADKHDAVIKRLKSASGVKVNGTAQFDPFSKELGVIANTIVETAGMKKEIRMDNSKVKRVELHMHTKMSQMDGMTNAKDLIKRAMKWGMKSIAITDHGVVQAFPEAHKLLGYDNPDMKIIYGVEAYLVPDKPANVSNSKGQSIDTTYCVLDLETTGISFRTEKITEIGIMKVKNGEVIDEFSTFVNPEKPIPQKVIDVTHITDDMVKDAPTIDEILPKALEFIGDSVIVAHNADFDVGFLKHNCFQLGLKLENTYVDTLRLAKDLFPDYKKYKLGIIAENLGIKVVDLAFGGLADYYEFRCDEYNDKTGVVINIGAHKTEISIVNEGMLTNAEVLDIGGRNIDRDISYIYDISLEDSKLIKEKFALATKERASTSEVIECLTKSNEHIKINQYEVSDIVYSRIREILELSKKQIKFLTKERISYIIVTGGTSELDGFKSVFKEIFGKSVEISKVDELGVRNNIYSSSLGVIKLYAEKLKFREKVPSTINEEEQGELFNNKKKINESSLLGKVYSYFFDN